MKETKINLDAMSKALGKYINHDAIVTGFVAECSRIKGCKYYDPQITIETCGMSFIAQYKGKIYDYNSIEDIVRLCMQMEGYAFLNGGCIYSIRDIFTQEGIENLDDYTRQEAGLY